MCPSNDSSDVEKAHAMLDAMRVPPGSLSERLSKVWAFQNALQDTVKWSDEVRQRWHKRGDVLEGIIMLGVSLDRLQAGRPKWDWPAELGEYEVQDAEGL